MIQHDMNTVAVYPRIGVRTYMLFSQFELHIFRRHISTKWKPKMA